MFFIFYIFINLLKNIFSLIDIKKGIEYSVDLMECVKEYENYVPEKLIEESIVSLKKSLENVKNIV